MKDWPKNVVTWILFKNIANLIMTGTGHFKGQGMTGWWDLCKQVNDRLICFLDLAIYQD